MNTIRGNVRLLGDRVLLERVPEPEKSAGGIILTAQTDKATIVEAVVLAVGPGRELHEAEGAWFCTRPEGHEGECYGIGEQSGPECGEAIVTVRAPMTVAPGDRVLADARYGTTFHVDDREVWMVHEANAILCILPPKGAL